MDKYQVLSRRYRPLVFSEVIGQETIVKTLKNALKTKKIPHAFLFSGIRGTGKTTTARIFARALNCREGIVENPCNVCENCIQQLEGRTLDIFEIDGASNTSVNDVRMLKENTRFLPSQLRYKVYIIDEVHMLSNEAFNALLKTLEEPPTYVIFILATTEPQKIPETVLSRCIRLNFKRVEPGEIFAYLAKVLEKENISYDDSALHMISRQADGSVRDALSILELILAYGSNRVSEEEVVNLLGLLSRDRILSFIKALGEKDIKLIFELSNQVKEEGGNFFDFSENVLFYLRHLATYCFGLDFSEKELSKDEISYLKDLVNIFSREEIPVFYQAFKKLLEALRYSSHPQFDFEMEMMKICALTHFIETESLLPVKKKTASPVIDKKTVSVEKKQETLIDFLKRKKSVFEDPLGRAEIKCEDDVCEITFSHRDKIYYEMLNEDLNEKNELISLLSEFYKRKIELKIFIANRSDSEDVKNDDSKSYILNDQTIMLIMNEFPGAKILGIKEIDTIKEDDRKEEEIENDIKGDEDE